MTQWNALGLEILDQAIGEVVVPIGGRLKRMLSNFGVVDVQSL
jgi:hypothetical protein